MFQRILKKNLHFLIPYAIVLLLVACILLLNDKHALHLQLNKLHSSFFDQFFRTITFFGDGAFPFVVATVFLFIGFNKAIIVSIIPSIAGLLSQFFKRVVFPECVRPKAIFYDNPDMHWVTGVDLHTSFSFPSGHTTTVFSLAFCLCFLSNRKELKIFWFVMALIVGYSRVYLSQHFLVDIYFGSLLGVITTFAFLLLYDKINTKNLNQSLLTLFKSRG